MVASFCLLLIEFVSFFVYLDLWLVYRKQVHVFTPLLAAIPVKQRKLYQGAYHESLKRDNFCVSDKVDVSGSTFTATFTVIYFYLFVANLFNLMRFDQPQRHPQDPDIIIYVEDNGISRFSFWL